MVTYKILLDTRRAKSDGTYPIVIRIVYDRKNTTLNTGVFVTSDYWISEKASVSSQHQNGGLLNKRITEEYLKIQKAVLELESENDFSFESLKERLNGQQRKSTVAKSVSFKMFSEQLVNDMLSVNETGNAIVYRTTINRFLGFVNDDKLKFNTIDYKLLDGFRRHLLKDGVKQNTVSNYFRTLRAIYNKAIKAKVVDRSRYPFLDISVKAERTAKRAISVDDLKTIANMSLKPMSRKWHAQNYFFLSFALIGASFTDLAYLTPANIRKGRLTYKRRKTGKELSIKLQPYTEAIIKRYAESSSKYLLPILTADVVEDSMRAKALIAQWIKTTNKWLSQLVQDCKLDCEVTTYVARHSWATTAKRMGYSIEVIAEAMGHEHGNRITNIYLDTFDQDVIDEANRKVIDSLL